MSDAIADPGLRIGARIAGRYDIRARLGAGGMGVVYEVLDRISDEVVALKTLRPGGPDPQLIKREFRALADVVHPNLVQLYDLFDDAGTPCMTMELVPGADMLSELCGDATHAHTATLVQATRPVDDSAPTATGSVAPARDEARVRDRFAQLARGVLALHRRGIVHRDIKPHNVRVTPEGRVVLLDFGLATVAGAVGPLAGTVAYMAPEQAGDAPVRPAADWFAFGVLLHEVLVGRVPWHGAAHEVLRRKRVEDAPSLAGRGELGMLVDELLRRDPDARPDGDAVLERLGLRGRKRGAQLAELERGIVGRRDELAQLAAAWATVASGGSAWLALEGRSGVGKTTLLDALANTVDGAVVVGRCYEREAVAYKGIDQIVATIVERLAARGAVCPEVGELVHAFPEARALAPTDITELPAARVSHDRRGAALRVLIGRLAAAAPLLVVLDDIQWADRDCLALLSHALAPPGIAGVMFVVAARPDPRSAWLELPMPFTRVRVGDLPDGEAVELAQRLLGRAALTIDGAALARSAGGHPLDLIERVRAALADDRTPGTARELLVRRVVDAPAEVRAVVELVALAGAPIPAAALPRASGIGDLAIRAALDRGQLAGLVRSRRSGARIVVEPGHDQVREAVFAALSPKQRAQRAAALAPALEAVQHEPAHVTELYALAGMPDAARRCAEDAAERMTNLGGHDAAAALWQQAASLAVGAARRDAERKAADALALAGRGSEAAAIYERLARDAATTAERLRDLRRAGEELLRAGRFAEGLALIEAHVDRWRDPREPAIALVRGLALHAATRAGRLPAPPRSAAPEQLDILDLRWAATAGYTLASPGHFMFAVETYLRAALAVGDPERISLGWSAEATLATFMGSARFADRCLERAGHTIAGVDAPRARAVAIATAGLVQLEAGVWPRAEALIAEALELADRGAPNLVWERNTAAITRAIARFHRGDFLALARDIRRDRDRIAARGDLYAHELVHSGFAVVADVLGDEAPRASAELAAFAGRPTGVLTAWLRAIAHAVLAAYGDDVARHRARIAELMAGPLGMPLVRSAVVRGTLAWTRAACELATGGDARIVDRAVAVLRRSRVRGFRALGDLAAAHAASLAGRRTDAVRLAASAELALVAEDMPGFAASARWLVEPETWPIWRDSLAQTGAVRPERVARLLAPSMRPS